MPIVERANPDTCSACGRPHREHPLPGCGGQEGDERVHPDFDMAVCPPDLDAMARTANEREPVILSAAEAAWLVDEVRRKHQRFPGCSLPCQPFDEETLEAVVQYEPQTGDVHSSGSRTALLVYIDRYLAAREESDD